MTTMATGGLPPAEIMVFSHFDLESHDFLNLFVPGQAILSYPEDSNSSSIDLSSLVGSILFQVQNLSNPYSELPILLYNILLSPHLRPHMQIATTSIPIFDGRRKNPGYGYRSLGSFHQFLPPYSTESRIDAVALDRAWGEMPKFLLNKRGLRAVGLKSFAKHFILILSNLHEQHSSEFDLSFLPSPLPALPDEASTSNNSPSQSFVTGAPTDQNVAYSMDNDFLRSPEITDNVGVAFILQRAGFTEEEIIKAVTLVSWFGLSVVKQDSCVKFDSGRKLTTEDVVLELGWKPSTFTRKFKAYRKAKHLARTSSWRNSPPSFASSLDAHATYVLWQAVKSMFADGGFCDRPSPPEKTPSAAVTNRRASTLSQNELYSKLTRLAVYLS
ncbi:hypothetical protein R3P38DRAFT_3058162 [Favolaschia claudopus]|uniref:MAT1-1-1 n=1 Tax=Favolaschia claudopus TaxID=2862362 RepID=A0AAW0A3J5_9AGAR